MLPTGCQPILRSSRTCSHADAFLRSRGDTAVLELEQVVAFRKRNDQRCQSGIRHGHLGPRREVDEPDAGPGHRIDRDAHRPVVGRHRSRHPHGIAEREVAGGEVRSKLVPESEVVAPQRPNHRRAVLGQLEGLGDGDVIPEQSDVGVQRRSRCRHLELSP